MFENVWFKRCVEFKDSANYFVTMVVILCPTASSNFWYACRGCEGSTGVGAA